HERVDASPAPDLNNGGPQKTEYSPGGYYAKNRLARPIRAADDPIAAKLLWDRSAEMVGLKSDDPPG
ncbi:hypothetical protein ACFFPJ_15520, partial [Microbacterium terregens]